MKIRSQMKPIFRSIFAVLPELQNKKLLTIQFPENERKILEIRPPFRPPLKIWSEKSIKAKTLEHWYILGFSNSYSHIGLVFNEAFCGLDGTRTRDPLRDRQVF